MHRPAKFALPQALAGQGSAGLCRISLPQGGNAPLRLRLTAHPAPLAGEPSGRQAAEMCPGGRERPPYNAGHTGGGAGTAGAARFGGTMRALPPTGGVSERSRYEVPALSAEIVPYGCRAGFCRALQDISAARRQCTPQSAPCGASSSPCRGAFLSGSFSQSLPCKGRCRRRRRKGAAPGLASTLPARRRVWRSADVCVPPPTCGDFVGRAILPAAWGLRHRRALRGSVCAKPKCSTRRKLPRRA